jgi:hypothetical protein
MLHLLQRARALEGVDRRVEADAMRRPPLHLDALIEPDEPVDEEVVEGKRVVVAQVDVALEEEQALEPSPLQSWRNSSGERRWLSGESMTWSPQIASISGSAIGWIGSATFSFVKLPAWTTASTTSMSSIIATPSSLGLRARNSKRSADVEGATATLFAST